MHAESYVARQCPGGGGPGYDTDRGLFIQWEAYNDCETSRAHLLMVNEMIEHITS